MRAIINKKFPSRVRLACIMIYANKSLSITDELAKYSREVDMINHVYAGFAVVVCKLPLSVFDNHHMTSYISQLDSKYSPRHRLAQLHVLDVMSDVVLLEYSKIMIVSL